jgi:D-glycero-D-manno-heptose 1,7-bisphosphate phosphatase
MTMMNKAIFLDRDGVLVKDCHLLTSEEDICILPGVLDALTMFVLMQYKLIVISNQTVVARGLLDEQGVKRLHSNIIFLIAQQTGILLDDFFFCPHHPDASIEKYRTNCTCRKPEPGMILEASAKHHIDLKNSYMIGDRISDCIAGIKAGCSTVMLQTGCHSEKPITGVSNDDLTTYHPDFICDTLLDAAQWIGYR